MIALQIRPFMKTVKDISRLLQALLHFLPLRQDQSSINTVRCTLQKGSLVNRIPPDSWDSHMHVVSNYL